MKSLASIISAAALLTMGACATTAPAKGCHLFPSEVQRGAPICSLHPAPDPRGEGGRTPAGAPTGGEGGGGGETPHETPHHGEEPHHLDPVDDSHMFGGKTPR